MTTTLRTDINHPAGTAAVYNNTHTITHAEGSRLPVNNHDMHRHHHGDHRNPLFGSTTAPEESSSSSGCWSETALSWWRRSALTRSSNKTTATATEPKNPWAAARAFVQGHQTGVPFLKITRRRRKRTLSLAPGNQNHNPQNYHHSINDLPVVELSGSVAKTSTLLTMAAKFAVQTRPSRYNHNLPSSSGNDNAAVRTLSSSSSSFPILPQVFLLDSEWNVSASQVHKLVRSTLLCDYDNMAAETATTADTTTDDTTTDDMNADSPELDQQTNGNATANDEDADVERLANDCEQCTQRIHLAFADENNSVGWLPILESLSSHLEEVASLQLHHHYHHPTLVLWDGLGSILDNSSSGDEASRTEIQRVLLRLIQDYNVMFVYTSVHALPRRRKDWDERVTHRIRLEKAVAAPLTGSSTTQQHPFVAQITGTREVVQFSFTPAGLRA